MKKQSKGIFFLGTLIIVVAAGGTFLLVEHLGAGVPSSGGIPSDEAAPAAQPYADLENGGAASDTAPATIAMQNFSNPGAGYSFSAPVRWNIEKTGANTVAVHSDASSSVAACKIEISVFPYSAGADGEADWIAHRIGADPSLSVTEQSSENVSLAGSSTGVEWVGTIDGVSTTLVYAFNATHAYEIAPSVTSATASGTAQCSDMLQSFLSTFSI
jgi:hypothetical protein